MANQDLVYQRFLKLLDEAIRQSNREVIDPMIPDVSVKSVLPLAVMVAKLRGRYLKEAFETVNNKKDGLPDSRQVERLREFRLEYEEMLAASQALEQAISRGYLTLSDDSA